MNKYEDFKKRLLKQTESFSKRNNIRSSVHIVVAKNEGQFDHGYMDTAYRDSINPNKDLHWEVGFGLRNNPVTAEAEHWHEMGHVADYENRRRNGVSINTINRQDKQSHKNSVLSEQRANAYARQEINKMPSPQQAQAKWFLRAGLNTHQHPEYNYGIRKGNTLTYGKRTLEKYRREGNK
jgi:hypothetical protein